MRWTDTVYPCVPRRRHGSLATTPTRWATRALQASAAQLGGGPRNVVVGTTTTPTGAVGVPHHNYPPPSSPVVVLAPQSLPTTTTTAATPTPTTTGPTSRHRGERTHRHGSTRRVADNAAAFSLPLPIPAPMLNTTTADVVADEADREYARLCDYRLWVFTQRVSSALGPRNARQNGLDDFHNYASRRDDDDDDVVKSPPPDAAFRGGGGSARYYYKAPRGIDSSAAPRPTSLMFDLSVHDGY